MNELAISVRNISKKFRLFNSPNERFLEAFHPFKKKYHKEFWALKDVSFDVPRGQTVGIIGRNGSGKSTLLQILCSILKPTTGAVIVNGRISALLELGSGFNPEFTGRQNVLMKGMLMGFAEEEMKKRLPEIEAFADIGEFIDQPMKIYSSGMAVRLAFAAAIHVDPDILIIDEALAVGDAKFQHKCYGKFLEFQKEGKTIVLVTHDINAVVKHCDIAILLEKGEIIGKGEPKLMADCYTELLFSGRISNYQLSPRLLEEGVSGFNLVCYRNRYYAFSQELGSLDIAELREEKLTAYVSSGECFIGTSLDGVKRQLRERKATHGRPLEAGVPPSSCKTKSELEKFLEESFSQDNCVNRKSYNKNEFRQGDRGAEIIDYLIVAGDRCDAVTIRSGDVVDIYVKYLFHRGTEFPVFGFSIKTVDGILLYGYNTMLGRVRVNPVMRDSIRIVKFSIKVDLNAGDYFINLGCSELVANETIPCDKRYSVIHIVLRTEESFTGLTRCETLFGEIRKADHENKHIN